MHPPRIFPTGYRLDVSCATRLCQSAGSPARFIAPAPPLRCTMPALPSVERDFSQIALIAHSIHLLRGSGPGQETAQWLEAARFWRQQWSRGPVRRPGALR